jgi:hypothetical protein
VTNLSYASARFPEPRPFQRSARELLRAGFVAGHRCQMVMSPTGSGKTILAMFLIHEALMRNKRVIFVADRRTLINQTSEVADSLGLIYHSVMMADSWRYDPELPFQIASAQTLAMRDWPDADLVIIDEAHTQMKVWTEHIQTCRGAVIGLSATPFSAGLGKLFSNLVNATTMAELTASGVCTRGDMKGAATAGGEWTDQAASQRGMQIIGNVVQEAEQAIIGALLHHNDVINHSGTLEPHRLCLKCAYLGGAADARRYANWRVTYIRGNAIPAELIDLLQRRAGFTQCAGLAPNSLAVPLDEWLAGLASFAEDGDE